VKFPTGGESPRAFHKRGRLIRWNSGADG